MKPETATWIKMAEGDFAVHEYAFKSAHYPQAIYLLCQAIEKLLKAAQIEFKNKAPKKIHRLEIIATDSGIEFSAQQVEEFIKLSQHYAKVRYPDFARNDYNTKTKTAVIIKNGQTLYKWISKQFKNH